MRYKKIILLICITMSVLFTLSCAFANEVTNETISVNDLNADEIQLTSNEVNDSALKASDSLSTSVVYFDASAASDGDGSQSKPYKYYKSDRIDYATTAYFADGVYELNETSSIYSSQAYRTTFIGQSLDKTILISNLANKFDFTVTDNSYFVLNHLTMVGVHINNQANLIASDVEFKNSDGFTDFSPSLSYSYISKIYDSTYGGVIICDTPSNRRTTLNLTDCYFIDNNAISGGVLATYNTVANIQNCVFYNSSATRFGGVIYSIKSTFNVINTLFEKSHAKYGGAIYANATDITLKDSQFNISQADSFGGVIASFSSNLKINHVVFNDYASLSDAGGSIYAIGGTLNLADSTFQNGYAMFGGALCTLKCDSEISATDFISNGAAFYGGSIYNMYATISLTGNDFTKSNASIGGAIFNRLTDSFTLTNNRFTTSTANDGPLVFIDGGTSKITQSGNTYDASLELLKYGNVYDVNHYESVPVINFAAELPETLPSFYDSRKYGYVTSVKDQIQGGNCWAFSGIATLEACLKKATGIEYDFSEENVKNLMSDYSLFDLDSGANNGGNLYMFIAYLAGWFGPTYDENDVYDDYSSISKIFESLIHVQNVYILPERESFYDNNHIKEAVLKYGAVSIGIDLSETQGHAVTIIGWDDEFVSNDFLGNKAVGAWIVKNSWGTNWGFDGYGYLSYMQPISYGYTFIFNDEQGYTDIYQYDFAGKSGIHTIDGGTVYIKNKFTAKGDEILSAFSTYFDEPTNYTVSVNLNGKEVTTQSGTSQMGYYTIPFKNEVSLKKGDSFEIVVKIFNDGKVYLPLSSLGGINKIAAKSGISFYSVDGKSWSDLYTTGMACIKGFTRLNTLSDISINVDDTASSSFSNVAVGDLINIQLDLPSEYDVDGVKHALDGIVTFTINGENYFADVENGKACLNMTFDKEGTYDVKAQFKSTRVVSDLIDFTVKVVKSQTNLVIQANDVSKFYGGSEQYAATLYKDGNALSGVNVKITVNGKEYNVKTDNKGQAILNLNLPVGVYDIALSYGGKTVTSKYTVLTTIMADDVVQDFLNSTVSASFVNTDGEMLSNQKITFNVTIYGVYSEPKLFDAVTDSLGVASSKINLYADKYSVHVVNPASGEEKRFILDVSEIESETSLTVSQPSSDVIIIDATLNSAYASGYVNFIVLGKVYKQEVQRTTVDGGTVAVSKLSLKNLAVGDYSVSAVYSGDNNFKVSTDSRDFAVVKNPYTITSHNYESFFGRSGTIAQITDSSGKGVKGEVVTAKILDNTYTSTTDDDGNAIFNLDLDAGNYEVLFEYKGQTLLKRVFIYSTINMTTESSEYLNSNIGTYIINPRDGSPQANANVKFIANGKEYTATTDSNGYASAKVDLAVGTHTVTVVNLDNGEKIQSKVKIYKTTPTVTISKSKHGNLIFFTAKLTHSTAVGNVVFTMGSKKYTSPVIDGESVLALRNMEEGSYDIYANYIGDANFNNILSSTMNFDYVYTNYVLTAPKLSKYYGGSDKFTATLTNFDNPAANLIIFMTLNDKVYEVRTGSNGVASLDVQLNPGSYGIQCTVEDDEDINVLSEIEVKSTITVDEGVGVSYSKMNAELRDGNGNLIKNTDVTFKIGSDVYEQKTDLLGVASFEPSLNKGNYNVTIINPVTGESKDSTLIVTKSVPTISISQVKENSVDVLKAVLPKTATGLVDFVLDNGEEYSSEIENGVATLEGLDPGEYLVTVKYGGNDEFTPVSKTFTFNVSELKAIMTASKVTTVYGTSKNIVVTVKDSTGNPLTGKAVTVILNNKAYRATVQSDGKAIISGIPSSLAVKTYVATITYAGDEHIKAETIHVNYVVNKATPKLAAAKKTLKLKDKTKKYVVTLKTNKNKVYKSQKVTVKVNGKTYTAKTNSKGQAIFKLTKLTKKGTFTATVKFSGNSNYKAVTKKVKITVK